MVQRISGPTSWTRPVEECLWWKATLVDRPCIQEQGSGDGQQVFGCGLQSGRGLHGPPTRLGGLDGGDAALMGRPRQIPGSGRAEVDSPGRP